MRAARASWPLMALATGIALAAPACSVVEGWSDLQGGSRTARDSGSSNDDGSAQGDGSTGDGSSGGTDSGVDPSIMNVTCGAAHCPTGMGCCVDFGQSLACTTRAACTAQAEQFLTCSSPASCPATAPLCCYDFNESGATCRAGCGSGDQELCNPSDSKPCSGGKACTSTLAGVSTVPACQ